MYKYVGSPLVSSQISHVAIDDNNNKWISTSAGLNIFNEAGITDITVGAGRKEEIGDEDGTEEEDGSDGDNGEDEDGGDIVTGIAGSEQRVARIKYYPIPANGETKAAFTILESGMVEISLMDLNGKVVRELYRDNI